MDRQAGKERSENKQEDKETEFQGLQATKMKDARDYCCASNTSQIYGAARAHSGLGGD